jgi:hypothetical protein
LRNGKNKVIRVIYRNSCLLRGTGGIKFIIFPDIRKRVFFLKKFNIILYLAEPGFNLEALTADE